MKPAAGYPGSILPLLLATMLFVFLDGSILGINYRLSHQVETDSLAINLIGRQRMLSQRITKSLLSIASTPAVSRTPSEWTELADSTALFEQTLQAFEHGGRVISSTGALVSISAISDGEGRRLLDHTQRLWAPPRTKLKRLLDPRNPGSEAALADATVAMVGSNLRLLDNMNRLTSRIQSLSAAKTSRLRWLQFAAFFLAMINFVFIVRRLVARTGRTLYQLNESNIKLKEQDDALERANHELAMARDELERRVIERTRELHVANEGLRTEIAVRHEAEQRLRVYAEIINGTSEGVIISTADHTVVDVNAGYASMTGHTKAELVGTKLLESARQPATAPSASDWRNALAQRRSWKGELLLSRKDGSSVPCLAYVNEVQEERGETARYLACICHDISDLREQQAMLEHQATHDALTGLPNRKLLIDRLGRSITRAARGRHRLAVMFIDLDKFKDINDTLGHGAGDELLVAVSQRLLACIRDYDTLARLGGDEFVILADHIDDEQDISRLAERTMSALATPVRLGDGDVEQTTTCSIGISSYPEDGKNVESLMKNADIALYRAKQAGRANFQFFKAEMQVRLGERMSLEHKLRRALERDELVLHFQPQVDLRSGGIIGFEALVRWQSPELGLVPPARFIPLAEESNLILGIGEWVLNKACASISDWKKLGLRTVPVAVNVSAHQFAQQGLDRLTEQALQRTGVEPRHLELELTESLAMIDPDASINMMRRLKQIGVALSIDDFGTGYSNLSYLKRFPIDRLKLDQSFVRGLTSRSEERAISTAVIALAHALGLRAIAEGVETVSQLKLLAMLGCDEIQGYYFRKPMPETEVIELLARKSGLDLSVLVRAPYRRTILLVDDNPSDIAVVKRLLRNEAFELLTAGNAEQAYELLANNEIGVVISDYKMPSEDGIAFLSNVRQMYPSIVRIMLTGHAGAEVFTLAINQGEVFRFEIKPWDGARLLETLHHAFRRYEYDKPASAPAVETKRRTETTEDIAMESANDP